jgi:hypothetical protein
LKIDDSLPRKVETDDQAYLKGLKGGPLLSKRWELVQKASKAGVPTQIAISPCLAYTSVEAFGQRLLNSGTQRLIVDTVIAGDGAGGQRTARSPFARAEPSWAETSHATRLYQYLYEEVRGTGIAIGWSSAGFSGIPPRYADGKKSHGEARREESSPGLWTEDEKEENSSPSATTTST